jgi:hypothetical protein
MQTKTLWQPSAAGSVARLVVGLGFVSLAAMSCSKPAEAPASTSPPAVTPPSSPGLAVVVGTAPSGGAIVTLEPASPREFALPAGPGVMDQFGKQFVPAMLFVRVGQPVEFRNSEDTPHNVNVVRSRTGAEVFNVSTDPFQKHVHIFDRSGRYEVSCDIHPGMLASVVATTTPYMAVADERGRFTIADVEPGAYRLIFSLGGGETERRIDVTSPRTEITLEGS